MVKPTVKEELEFLQKVEDWIENNRHTKKDKITWSQGINPPGWMKDTRFTSFRSGIYWWNGYNWIYDLKFKEIIQRMKSKRKDKIESAKKWQESHIYKNQNTLDGNVINSKPNKQQDEMIRQKECLSPLFVKKGLDCGKEVKELAQIKEYGYTEGA